MALPWWLQWRTAREKREYWWALLVPCAQFSKAEMMPMVIYKWTRLLNWGSSMDRTLGIFFLIYKYKSANMFNSWAKSPSNRNSASVTHSLPLMQQCNIFCKETQRSRHYLRTNQSHRLLIYHKNRGEKRINYVVSVRGPLKQ